MWTKNNRAGSDKAQLFPDGLTQLLYFPPSQSIRVGRTCGPVAAPLPPCHPLPMSRNLRQGLTTLAAVFSVAVLTLTLQTRTAADRRLLFRLTDDLATGAVKDSLYDRLRPLIAGAMAGTTDCSIF